MGLPHRKLSKLRKMPLREITGRLGEQLRIEYERVAYRRRSIGRRRILDEPRQLLHNARRLVPGTTRPQLAALLDEYGPMHGRLRDRLSHRAAQITAGRWRMLGHDFDLTHGVDWHADPRSDHVWPRSFYADVDLRQSDDGEVDVKYVWELGRQQYCSELARTWRMTSGNDAALHCRRLILSWIEANPLYQGVHWTSALEVAMRSISWIWSLAALADWHGWQADDLQTIAGSLRDHATYLRHHLSLYSSPYNHLMGEATGLYLVGCVLDGSGDAETWRRVGRRVLSEHGPRQFYADGFTVEQATGYHFYTLGFLSLALLAGRRRGEPLTELEPIVHRAYRAGAAMRRPDGLWPAIGDVDSARSIPVHADEFWDFGSLCALGAVMFEDPELKGAGDGPGEELYWLLGAEGVRRWHDLGSAPPVSSTLLEDSGYLIARSGDDWLLFDAGPIADGLHPDATPSTAHGHADVFQVLFCHKKKPLLVDSGMPFYVGTEDWIRYFRGPASHCTFQIEGTGPARYVGRLDWAHVSPDPSLETLLQGPVHLASARAKWPADVYVERHLLWIPGQGLWVADFIETGEPRTVSWHWQLGDVLETAGDGPVSEPDTRDSEHFVLAGWTPEHEVAFRVKCVAAAAPVAWRAPGYGRKVPGRTACYTTQVTGCTLVVTHIGTCPDTIVQYRGFDVVCSQSVPSDPHLFDDDLENSELRWTIGTGEDAQTIRVATNKGLPVEGSTNAVAIPCVFS